MHSEHLPWKNSFYLVAVIEVVKNSKVDTFDAFQHCIVKGDNYLSCNYLEIEVEQKKCVHKCASSVFVLPGEVLSPFVNITDNLHLSVDEKQWLCDMA